MVTEFDFAFEVLFFLFTDRRCVGEHSITNEKVGLWISLSEGSEFCYFEEMIGGKVFGSQDGVDGDFFFEHIVRDDGVCVFL